MADDALNQLQADLLAWQRGQFPEMTEVNQGLVIAEEAGEVAHVIQRRSLGIKPEEASDERLREEIGDLGIALAVLAERRGWSLIALIRERAAIVVQRDYHRKEEGT